MSYLRPSFPKQSNALRLAPHLSKRATNAQQPRWKGRGPGEALHYILDQVLIEFPLHIKKVFEWTIRGRNRRDQCQGVAQQRGLASHGWIDLGIGLQEQASVFRLESTLDEGSRQAAIGLPLQRAKVEEG